MCRQRYFPETTVHLNCVETMQSKIKKQRHPKISVMPYINIKLFRGLIFIDMPIFFLFKTCHVRGAFDILWAMLELLSICA